MPQLQQSSLSSRRSAHPAAIRAAVVSTSVGTRPEGRSTRRSALAQHAGVLGEGTIVVLEAGETLFMECDDAKFLYEVVGGTMCTYKLMADGRRQITGFHFPGDLLGLHMRGVHVYSAEPVTTARLRRYAHSDIEAFAARSPDIAHHLLGLAEDELTSAQDQMLLLGRKTARERLSSFLLLLSERAERRGEAANPIALPMTRAHIADYLGLTVETVSRTMTQLRNAGLVVLDDSHMAELCDLDALEEIAAGDAPDLRRIA